MKALIFNHHPDNTWFMQESLKFLGIDCYIADHDLTVKASNDFSSVSPDFKLRKGSKWFDEKDLFEENTFKYSSTMEGFDFIFTIHRNIANNLNVGFAKLFFWVLVYWDLEQMNDTSKYVKVTSHYSADKWNAEYVPYFVPQKGEQNSKKYITQLIEGFNNVPYYNELMNIKNSGVPVIIAGSDNAPDGIVDDWTILKETTLLVHTHPHGINCNALLKALDCGIPIYIDKQNLEEIEGLNNLPEELFIYSNDCSIKDAYNRSLTMNNKVLQETYRKTSNKEITAPYLKRLLKIT